MRKLMLSLILGAVSVAAADDGTPLRVAPAPVESVPIPGKSGMTLWGVSVATLTAANLMDVQSSWGRNMALQLRFLERVPLGTPYPAVVSRVAAVTGSLAGVRPMRPGGGRDGGRQAGGGSAAERGADVPAAAVILTSCDLEKQDQGFYKR